MQPVEPQRMSIVFFNHTSIVSGAEKMLLLLLAGLPAESYKTVVICPGGGGLQQELRRLNIRQADAPAFTARFTSNPFKALAYVSSMLKAVFALRKTIVGFAPDLVHANTVRAGIVATLATTGTGLPVIWHTHDMLPAHPITFGVRLLAHLSGRVSIVACSAASARTIRPFRWAGRDVHVILNGIDMSGDLPGPEIRLSKRNELGLTGSNFVIGIVGMITPRKGQLGVIRAFAKLRLYRPDAALLIVGSPLFNNDHEYLDLLKNEAQRLGLGTSVRFLGQRADAQALLQAMDVLVSNSDKEPFALVLIEAMRAGVPVIASDSGGPREIIEHGVNGILVPCGAEESLVNAMLRLANDEQLCSRFSQTASQMVQRKFSSGQYVASWRAMYRLKALGPHGAVETLTPPHDAESQDELQARVAR